jgi:ribosomal protein S12
MGTKAPNSPLRQTQKIRMDNGPEFVAKISKAVE